MGRASSGRVASIALGGAMVAAACGGSTDASLVTVEAGRVARAPVAAASPAPTIEPETHLIFTGDLIPARCTYAALRALGDYTAPFQPLREILSSADITAGSLDSTISTAADPIGCSETFNLAGPAEFADGLAYAGYDVIAHAANHIKDCGNVLCGDASMLETRQILESHGIATMGSGADLARARAPAVVVRNGVRFAFLAYDDIADYYHATESTGGAAPLDAATVGADIASARRIADVVIIVPHWGVEYTASPSERQREFARAAAAAGADLVVGNHPHWVQAHERIGRTFVAYALGNFVFDQDWSLETQQGAMLEVTFAGARFVEARYIPVHIYDRYQPRLADGDEAREILDRIGIASAALSGAAP